MSCPDALLALGFDAQAYREAYPTLPPMSAVEAAAHYHVSGRHERFAATFALPLAQAQARIDALPLAEADRDQLRLDLAAAALRQTDVWGRDAAQLTALLAPSPAHRPLVVISDSHGMAYLSEEVLRAARLLPVPFLRTGATARGLGDPRARAGAGEAIRRHLVDNAERIGAAPVLLKFGQVDLEFVYDYRRIRDGRAGFDMAHAVDFAHDSARRYLDFAAALAAETRARLVVTAALPPALSDAALRQGYLNAHIAELHGELDQDALRRQLQGLEMPDWKTRTALAAAYNQALAAGCAAAGLTYYDDFTPLLGPDGVIDPDLIVWHGGTDHHLCAAAPAARRAIAAFARDIAAL
jgi:hypothetical protein